MTERETPKIRAVTRADVARYAGVSTAVVSYVINNGPKPVAPRTAARVREAIDLLSYRPNVNAQALRRGKTEMLGMILSDATNPFFTELAMAVGSAAARQGHALMMGNSHGDGHLERRLVDDLIRRQVDGLIVTSVFARPDLEIRPSTKLPIVWLDSSFSTPGFPSLGADGYEGARVAVDHLISVHGHTSIGLIGGDLSGSNSDPRARGWLDALRSADCPDGPLAHVDWSREGGYAGGQRLLDSRTPPTAIFASSDLQAIGLLRAAHERELRIPEDLAVIAFDGTKESEFSWPPLTVVAQPIEEMAQAAVRLVLDNNRPETHLKFQPQLVVRRSCGCSEG